MAPSGPSPDPASATPGNDRLRRRRDDRAHDVLAAEEFGVPAPDPAIRHGPVKLPDDPTGIAEPHDVLAAEEFAMPAPRRSAQSATGARSRASRAPLAAAAALAVLELQRRRRRKSRA